MSKLKIPDSWAETTLGEVGTTMIGLTYSPSDISEKGIPVLRSGNIQKGKIDLNDLVRVNKRIKDNLILKQGDIVICARNGSKSLVGKAAQVKQLTETMTFGAFMAVYRSQINDFVEKFFNSPMFRNLLEGVGTSTINQITQSNLKSFTIPIPPLKEQERIVAKIESTHDKIKTIESNIAQAETLIAKYRESILQKAFRGQLVPQNPNDEPASKLLERIRTERDKLTDPKKKKKDDLPPIKPEEIPFEIPKNWEWVRLGEILSLFNGHSFKQTEWKKTGVPIIRIQNLNNTETSQFNFYQGKVDQNWKVENGELLFAWSGSKGSSFGAHIWHNGDAVLNQHIFKVVPKTGIYKEYLYWLLRQFQKRIEEDAHGFKETFVHVRQSDLKKVVVPVPPFLEQKLIVKGLNENLGISKKFIDKLDLAKTFQLKLLRSIFDSAFSGRLVPQDPSEGTGYELLEDIKAQVSSQKDCDIKKLESKKITISKKVSRKK